MDIVILPSCLLCNFHLKFFLRYHYLSSVVHTSVLFRSCLLCNIHLKFFLRYHYLSSVVHTSVIFPSCLLCNIHLIQKCGHLKTDNDILRRTLNGYYTEDKRGIIQKCGHLKTDNDILRRTLNGYYTEDKRGIIQKCGQLKTLEISKETYHYLSSVVHTSVLFPSCLLCNIHLKFFLRYHYLSSVVHTSVTLSLFEHEFQIHFITLG
jgi:hypothetical protein